MEEPKFKSFTLHLKKGMEPIGDQAREWMTDKDYEDNAKYVEELKASGEYGQPYEITLNLMSIPEFDEPSPMLGNYGLLIPQGKLKEGDKIPFMSFSKTKPSE